MTVPTPTSIAGPFTGNGVTTILPVGFRFLTAADLVVTKTETATEIDTVLVLGTDYTVSGAGLFAGGSVTLLTPLAIGFTANVRRILDIVQDTDIKNQGPFFPEIHEDVFDRIIMICQQQQEQIDRFLTIADTIEEDNAATIAALVAQMNGLLASANAILAQQNAALDNFDDRYLGAFATEPTVDNDGNPLLTGALFFHTAPNAMKVWNGAAWVSTVSGAVLEEKMADEARTGDETAAIDGELVATLQAETTYFFDIVAFVSVAVEVGAGIKFALQGTAGIDTLIGQYRVFDDALVSTGVLTALSTIISADLDSGVAISQVHIQGTIKTTTTGTFGFGWSPAVAANTTTLKEGSSLKLSSGEGVQGPSGPPGPGMAAFAQSIALGATSAVINHNMNDSTVHLVNIVTDFFNGGWRLVSQDADNVTVEWANENPMNPGTLTAVISQSALSGPGGIIGPPGPEGPAGPAGPAGGPGGPVPFLYQVENLAAGVDIGDGTAANARTIFLAPAALTVGTITILSQGTPAGIDNANPLVIGVYRGTNLIVSKTYNTTTPFPANHAISSLGTLANNVFAFGEDLRIDVVGGATANPPSFIVQVEYTYD